MGSGGSLGRGLLAEAVCDVVFERLQLLVGEPPGERGQVLRFGGPLRQFLLEDSEARALRGRVPARAIRDRRLAVIDLLAQGIQVAVKILAALQFRLGRPRAVGSGSIGGERAG